MQTSTVPPPAPALNKNEISVSREISVVSSYSDARPATSVPGTVRPSFDGSRGNSATANRASSMTSIIGRPRVEDGSFGADKLNSLHNLGRRSVQEMERDRQNLRDLAEFLRTKEPPKDNWISHPDSADRQSKSPLRLFGRKRSRSKTQKPFQLPDSAVAAKTISGHWHIAISIPNEYDLLDGTPRNEETSAAVPKKTTPTVLHSSRDGPIRVLKPVSEDRPLSVGTDFDAAAIVSQVFPDPQQEAQGLEEIPRPQDGVKLAPPNKTQRAYIAVSPDVLQRSDSQRSDRRHSGGTSYSERSVDTDLGHSRGASSVSTAPSVNNLIASRGIDPPTRFSSKSAAPMSLDAILPATSSGPSGENQYRKSATSTVRDSTISQRSVAESISSDVSDGKLGIADTARNPGSPDIVNGRQTPRLSGPAPSRKLPDLPETSDDNQSIRTSVRSGRTGSVRSERVLETTAGGVRPARSNASLREDSLSRTSSGREKNQTSREQRQERVKALRSRDIAALKEKNRNVINVLESPNVAKLRSPSTPPAEKQMRKRRSVSASPSPSKDGWRRSENALTKIMLVADVKPDYELSNNSELTFPGPSRSNTQSAGTKSSHADTHTPPRSPTPSLQSSDEEGDFTTRAFGGAVPVPSRPYVTRTRGDSLEQRAHASIVAPLPSGAVDKSYEFETRLARIEKNNATMMQTLNAVLAMGKGLGELSRLQASGRAHGTEGLERRVTDHVGKGLGEIEPLMRELRGASRISQEGGRPSSFGDESLEDF